MAGASKALWQWGPVQFELYPLNIHELDHNTATEWARKEVAGAAIYREWVGENDEQIDFRGRVFPEFFEGQGKPSGLSHLDQMDRMRRLGQAHMLMRGDGTNFGWYVIEKLARGHTFIDARGIGRQIAFEASFQRVPVPSDGGSSGGSYFSSTFGGGQ